MNPTSFFRAINPFTLHTSGEYHWTNRLGLDKALARAKLAQSSWQLMPVAERAVAVQNALRYFRDNANEIALDITSQMGKPLRQAENEVKGLLERAEYLVSIAEAALLPEVLTPKQGFHRRIEHVPLGVVLIIAPWNYPLLTAINGVAAALLSGNAVLLKHSTLTPAIGGHFAQAFGQLGGIEDVLQSVFAPHEDLEEFIRESPVDHVLFTGSVAGGRRVQQCAAHRFIDCHLELGGKDAAYVAEDADLEKAVESLVDGAMYNAGQSCCGIERVYVHAKHFQAFVEKAVALVKGYRLGDPMDPETNLGPVIHAQAAQAMLAQVEQAVREGANVLTGGAIHKIGAATFFEPTLLVNVTQTMAVMQDENFGPILPILSVQDDAEAIRLVNDSNYGLTSAIYTRDLARANRFAAEARTGTVFMNRCDYLDPALPWTGVGDSGKGSSLSQFGFYGVTRRKAIHFRLE